MKFLILALSLFALLGVVSVQAHKGATGIVKTRMDSMKSIASEMKKLKGILFSGQSLKVDEVKTAAREIKKHAEKVPVLFPEGSMKHPSEATKAIWENRKDFDNLAGELAAYADALLVSASNNSDPKLSLKIPDEVITDVEVLKKSAPQAVFFSLAKSCQDCHKVYRLKK